MKLTDELFLKYVLIEKTLLPYGFTKNGEVYSYKRNVYHDEFELQVSVENGKPSAKLIEKAFDEEYDRINAEGTVGGFVADIKEECAKVLTDIRDHCFEKVCFISPQANRVAAYVKKQYGVSPEFLWDDTPDCGVFRNGKGKWFGIIMNVKKNRIIKTAVGDVEVINLKLDEEVPDTLRCEGVFPAYHMNKKYWVSVVLDDTLSDETIFTLLETSFSASNKK